MGPDRRHPGWHRRGSVLKALGIELDPAKRSMQDTADAFKSWPKHGRISKGAIRHPTEG